MAYSIQLSGSKLRSQLSSQMNESAARPPPSNSFARQQLMKMGWTEGTGLGKRRDGISTHLRVTKKREETSGLGIELLGGKMKQEEEPWWSRAVGETLAQLNPKQQTKKKKKRTKESNINSEDENPSNENHTTPLQKRKRFTDEELFKATGGARFGMRAQRRATGKWARTESSKSLEEEERLAKTRFEWNGLGDPPQITSLTSPTKTTSNENEAVRTNKSEVGTTTSKTHDNMTEEIRSKKSESKVKKKNKKKKETKKEPKQKKKRKREDSSDDDNEKMKEQTEDESLDRVQKEINTHDVKHDESFTKKGKKKRKKKKRGKEEE